MITAVDSSVLLDVFLPDPDRRWFRGLRLVEPTP